MKLSLGPSRDVEGRHGTIMNSCFGVSVLSAFPPYDLRRIGI